MVVVVALAQAGYSLVHFPQQLGNRLLSPLVGEEVEEWVVMLKGLTGQIHLFLGQHCQSLQLAVVPAVTQVL
jgi:hypothetical protein